MILDWNARFKIAIGSARGLRYLHEDCRVGCIVHRDFRPSNILLTHDFEPMVSATLLGFCFHTGCTFKKKSSLLVLTANMFVPLYITSDFLQKKIFKILFVHIILIRLLILALPAGILNGIRGMRRRLLERQGIELFLHVLQFLHYRC